MLTKLKLAYTNTSIEDNDGIRNIISTDTSNTTKLQELAERVVY
jgi:hypothetical protein